MGAAFGNRGAGVRISAARALAVAALLIASLSCAGSSDQGSEALVAETVHGLITHVDSRSLLRVRSLTVVDDSGARWVFEADRRFDDFTPSHLREHMVLGLPLTITFHREDGRLIMDELAD